MTIEFYKYQRTGNDFVILDRINQRFSNLKATQIQQLCDRIGIGGDRLMLLNLYDDYDFEMKYYNADGRKSFQDLLGWVKFKI